MVVLLTPSKYILTRYNIGRSVEDRQVAKGIKINQVMLNWLLRFYLIFFMNNLVKEGETTSHLILIETEENQKNLQGQIQIDVIQLVEICRFI
jgi:hypothetical protein